MRALLGTYFLKYRRRWVVGFVFAVGSVTFGLMTPWLLRQAIDAFSTGSSQFGWDLPAYALAIVGVAVLEGICRFVARLEITGASRWVEYDLRNRYFAHLESLEPAFFVR